MNRCPVVFVHSSNEMYGADRMLLEVLRALPIEDRERAIVLLPDDASGTLRTPLVREIQVFGVDARIASLPVLRRKYFTPRGLLSIIRNTVRFFWLIQSLKPEVVYCSTSATLPAAWVGWQAGALVVLHAQEVWLGRQRSLLALLARPVRRVVAVSGAARGSLPTWLQDRAVVVPNGMSPPSLPVAPLEAHEGVMKFLVASRWNDWKGHDTLLRAWRQAGEPGILTVVGGRPQLGNGVDVPSLVEELDLASSVVIVGEVADITPYVDAADCMVVPSDNPEPFGLVAIEAFSRGRPVVGSDGGGLAEIIEDAVTGRLFPLRDVEALANLLRCLSRSEAGRMGRRAEAVFAERYSQDAFARSYRKFWLGLRG